MLAGKSTRRWGTMNTVGNKITSFLNINNRENVRLSESHWWATKTTGSQQWREKPSYSLTRRTVSSSWKPTNKLSEASQQMAHRLLTLCPPLHVSLPSFQMPFGTVKAKSDATSAISCRGLLCSDAQSCDFLWPHVLYSPPGSSVHGISQATILEWVAISSSMERIFRTQGLNPCLLCLLHWQSKRTLGLLKPCYQTPAGTHLMSEWRQFSLLQTDVHRGDAEHPRKREEGATYPKSGLALTDAKGWLWVELCLQSQKKS